MTPCEDPWTAGQRQGRDASRSWRVDQGSWIFDGVNTLFGRQSRQYIKRVGVEAGAGILRSNIPTAMRGAGRGNILTQPAGVHGRETICDLEYDWASSQLTEQRLEREVWGRAEEEGLIPHQSGRCQCASNGICKVLIGTVLFRLRQRET